MIKTAKKWLGVLGVITGLLAATPAYAAPGFDIIYLDDYGNIVGYELNCQGVTVQSYGEVTNNILWFYTNACP
ncbi:hypothetical protein M3P36_00675 [Altererythrobacter sp. KTW20L]|uniref:hypothetical protein n=1 Tax=Altererythrobacter sp. KTW20L TaxID=2942210 RepID=UPI0020C169F6|nr:hypothetical protein [Altererythrobacter sp. KTW20L]MCL6249563.1 hypothetical protein [Altererythrobacter sp. KTW20L]